MSVDMDTDDWLGCPTPLEMYQHQCSILVDELVQTERMLRRARANITGLVQMNDLLMTGRDQAETSLKDALSQVAALNLETSRQGRKLNGLAIITEQRDHLLRENQRLLEELRALKEPQP
ncbi:hypothetical protein [Pseudomonas fluorescens]|uniref:Uncharacterized protein n=1 Tax=Pseudomonas fluorescens TaxID=294 RepID=A0A2T0IHU4_PSEFL|nr:hypothetical protein C7A10_04450 [Pseudomonas fluorescens]